MRRALLIILLITSILPAYSQWASVNIDTKTVAAMKRAYATEFISENLSDSELDKILKHYSSAEVATAGIFSSKWLDRQALKNAGRFGDAQRNYYYRRIYQLVSAQIMPKVFNVAALCVKHPEKAIYWGPYLFKVTEEVKHLCMQFESVVCNGKVSFQDIVFFCINDDLKSLFDLAKFGEVDWEAVWDNLCDFGSGITMDDLKTDLESLMNLGSAIAGAGGGVAGDAFASMSGASRNLLTGRVDSLYRAYQTFESIYSTASDAAAIKQAVLDKIGSTDSTGVANLLSIDGYNIGRYISDYVEDMKGQYYKQRWYIEWKLEGEEVLCDYTPPSDNYSVNYGNEWKRFRADDSIIEYGQQQAKANSEGITGWSSAKAHSMNAANDGYTYSIAYTPYMKFFSNIAVSIYPQVAFAYGIRVVRTCNKSDVVYEEIFDSYSMDINVFRAYMQGKVDEYNAMQTETITTGEHAGMKQEATNPRVYSLHCDEKQYYSESDEKKMQGCESVSFVQHCYGENKLGNGSLSWKVNQSHNHNSVGADSKEYAMETTLSASSYSTATFDERISALQAEIDALEAQINALTTRNNELLALISKASVEEAAAYRKEYNDNQSRISDLNAQLTPKKSELQEVKNARQELVSEYENEPDGVYRIPAVMKEIETAYNITWNTPGHWSGNTFVRVGSIPNIDSEITFSAELSCTRGESHFLGIRTHRAILNVNWTLVATYDGTSVIEVMELPQGLSDGEKNQMVNDRLHELNSETGCVVEPEYFCKAPAGIEGDNDEIHLLWVSDRLQIARNIEYRLARIYANLVLTEKFLRQKESILTYLKRRIFCGLPDGSSRSLGSKSFRRWRNAARHISEGKKPEDVVFEDEE